MKKKYSMWNITISTGIIMTISILLTSCTIPYNGTSDSTTSFIIDTDDNNSHVASS